jgi:hypothetical protein
MPLTQLNSGSQETRDVVNAIATAVDALGTAGNVVNADLAANAVSGAKVAAGTLKKLVFTGHNLAGACTCTGAAVGDKVVGATNLTDATQGNALFESVITVANQIQQSSATDLSAKKFDLLLISVT